MTNHVCPTCGNGFESLRPRKFCCRWCYRNSPAFKERWLAAMASGRAKKTGRRRKGKTRRCAQCDTPFYHQASAAQTFCKRACYVESRKTWLQPPVHLRGIRIPDIDAFLSADPLRCPYCNWTGRSLGHHLYQRHRMTAAEFKTAHGLDESRGLNTTPLASVTRALSRDPKP